MDIFGQTHQGIKKNHNEDSFWYDESLGAAIVSDGMGGEAAGEIASRITVETFKDSLRFKLQNAESLIEVKAVIANSISESNLEVLSSSKKSPAFHRMGATAVCACLWNESFVVANIGDSRAYLVREGRIKQLTTDHSFIRKLLEKGAISREEALTHPQRNRITRYIGNKENARADFFDIAALPGDFLILCSDGLSSVVPENDMLNIVRKNPSIGEMAEEFIQKTLEGGAPDNVTVVLLRPVEYIK
ncbi:Stp1/IreP family PP2C-type Ser/Thr phosphatase [Candidatus Latescibacterota bacterium]